MKERPILFSGPMVRAILEGRKTQTRRTSKLEAINLEASSNKFDGFVMLGKNLDLHSVFHNKFSDVVSTIRCPYGKVGDRLWVRETTEADEDSCDAVVLSQYAADGAPVLYAGCEDPEYNGSAAHWNYPRPARPSIHMPRWASRITLEITGVRVERLRDISDEDARAEGASSVSFPVTENQRSDIDRFRALWNLIHGAGAWGENPWVWAIEFKRVEP